MRLGAAFVAFSGLELLKPAIRSARRLADFVAVVYCEVSHRGLPAAPYMRRLLEDLRREGLVDCLRPYAASSPARSPEEVVEHMRRQRDLGRRICLEAGCTHVMLRDCDEFYAPGFPRLALRIASRFDVTFSRMVDYTASPLYRARHARSHDRVPFIQRADLPVGPSDVGVHVDPARTVAGAGSWFVFPSWLLLMHHMTRVRIDEEELRRKYESHSWYPRVEDIRRLTEETRRPDMRKYRVLAEDRFGILEYWGSEFRAYAAAGRGG